MGNITLTGRSPRVKNEVNLDMILDCIQCH